MIALATKDGRLLRLIDSRRDQAFGYHKALGFVSERTAHERGILRRRQGYHWRPDDDAKWLCRFRVAGGEPESIAGCSIVRDRGSERQWQLKSDAGEFIIFDADSLKAVPVEGAIEKSDTLGAVIAWAVVLGLTAAFVIVSGTYVIVSGTYAPAELKVKTQEQLAATQKAVVIPQVKVAEPRPEVAPEAKPEVKIVQEKPKKSGTAVQNKLGFLSLLGKTDLKKAVGGMPTPAQRRSPGAGVSGTQGSGGELLSGLGQGVHHTTLGNTGVAGLGGIGNAGAGGGEGGFGKGYVGAGGSGGGRVLSEVSLAKDVELDGGLDRAVIQATIAKYLSQIRACYERGLHKNPGLTGQVTMDFEIGAAGKLNYAKVKKSSLDQHEVEACIAKVMLSWQFPKPVGGTLVKVNYPFMLKPAG